MISQSFLKYLAPKNWAPFVPKGVLTLNRTTYISTRRRRSFVNFGEDLSRDGRQRHVGALSFALWLLLFGLTISAPFLGGQNHSKAQSAQSDRPYRSDFSQKLKSASATRVCSMSSPDRSILKLCKLHDASVACFPRTFHVKDHT